MIRFLGALPVVLLLFSIHGATLDNWNDGALAFEPNRGQTAARVRFLARAPGHSIFLTDAGMTLALRDAGRRAALRLEFLGTTTPPRYEGLDLLPGQVHYLRGRDARRWRTGLPTWSRVRARGVYPGIDVIYHGRQGRLEYDFVVAAEADPGQIQLVFDGGEAEVTSSGDLLIQTAAGPLRHQQPIAWQVTDSGRRPVAATYAIGDSGAVRIELGPYDSSRELVIDPVVRFSTFLGGSGVDEARALAVGPDGSAYVAGITDSPDFPVAGAFDPDLSTERLPGDAFVTRLAADGRTVLYSTFLGGSATDVANAIALGSDGSIYIAGDTESSDYPTTFGALQVFNSSLGIRTDGFVTKLSPDGSALVYSTYFGGDFTERIYGLAVDETGSAYIAGSSDSNLRTAGNPVQTFCPGIGLGGFVAKLSPNGSALIYGTRLCGSANDEVLALALDEQGRAVVGGVTQSADFPVTPGALRTLGGGDQQDGFLARVSADGSSLDFSTYLGGADTDTVHGVAVAGGGSAVAAGFTHSADFPVTPGAIQPQHADSGAFPDGFVTVIDSTGSGLLWSTFLGGPGRDQVRAAAVDTDGGIHVTGFTESRAFPTTRALCQTAFAGRSDTFAARFIPGGELDYSFFLGGREEDTGLAVAAGPDSGTYIAGQTSSSGFPTSSDAFAASYANGYRGGGDAFVARLDDGPAPSLPCLALGGLVNGASFLPGPVAPGEIISLFGAGIGPDAPAVFQLDGGSTIATSLAGTEVLFDGIPAPVISASSGQVNAIVPYAVAGRDSTIVQVRHESAGTATVEVPVAAASPAVFTVDSSGRGQGAVLNQDFTVNGPSNPAAKGTILQIFATGEGQTTPPGVDGLVATNALPAPELPVTVTLGGLPAIVTYAGAAPGLVAGVLQVNIFVPLEVTTGNTVPLFLDIGGHRTPPGVTVAIR